MPDPAEVQTPMPAHRRRVFAIAVVRGLSIVTVLVVAYFALPLDELAKLPFGVIVAGGVVIVAAVTMLEVRSIIRAAHPAAKAIEALAVTVPLFLLLFASTYYMMSQANPGNFNLTGLTRGDSLYFTVTVFTTVGFGDILATSQQRPRDRNGPDDPRPGPDRCRDQGVRSGGQDRPQASGDPNRRRLTSAFPESASSAQRDTA